MKPYQKFEGHTDWVVGVIHLPGGQQIMTCSRDGSIGVWNLQTGKQIASWWDGESPMYTAALSVDGKKVVSGGGDGAVRLWSIETGKVIARLTGHPGSIVTLCWSGDSDRVLSGSGDGTARVWDVETGKTMLEIKTSGHSGGIVFTTATSAKPPKSRKAWKHPQGLPRLTQTTHVHNGPRKYKS